MESWMLGPPLLIGEKVFYTKHGFIVSGTVKWLGRLQEAFGNKMVAGLVLVRNIENIYILLCDSGGAELGGRGGLGPPIFFGFI